MPNDMTMNQLCDIVRQTSYDIHVYHGHGMFEKIYERALVHRLRKLGIDVKQQHSLTVYDEDGTSPGDYIIDIWVDDRLIVELKIARMLTQGHIAQIMGYLRAMRVKHGMLINFGSARFQLNKLVL